MFDHAISCLHQLQEIPSDEQKNTVDFIIQLKNVPFPVLRRDYETELMVFLQFITFNFTYSFMIFPHPSTTKNVCSQLHANCAQKLSDPIFFTIHHRKDKFCWKKIKL